MNALVEIALWFSGVVWSHSDNMLELVQLLELAGILVVACAVGNEQSY